MKPTFLTVSESLAFRNKEHRPYNWKVLLNGVCVSASQADSERGYVDVIDNELGTFPPRVRRLFGEVRFKSVFDEFDALLTDMRPEPDDWLTLWAGTAEGLM